MGIRKAGLVITCVAVLTVCSGRLLAELTEEEAMQPPVLKVYDVRDLVFVVPSYNPPEMALGPFASGGEGQVVGGGGPWGGDQAECQPDDVAESAEELIELIKMAIEPGTWEEGGGNSINYSRGVLVAVHRPAVQPRVQDLLTQLRENRKTDMVSVHISLVTPTREAMEEITSQKKLLAVSADQKADLLKLAGPKIAEVKLLAMDGQLVNVTTSWQIEFALKLGKDVEADSATPAMVAWMRATVMEGDAVLLNAGLTLSKLAGKGTASTRPDMETLQVGGTYRVPDGAMLLTSGGTSAGPEPKEVYALIQVDVIPASPKR